MTGLQKLCLLAGSAVVSWTAFPQAAREVEAGFRAPYGRAHDDRGAYDRAAVRARERAAPPVGAPGDLRIVDTRESPAGRAGGTALLGGLAAGALAAPGLAVSAGGI